jgi:hypothetical protein
MTISAPGATAEDVKSVVQTNLASELAVNANNIDVSVSESRRLQNFPDVARRLAGTFAVSYSVSVPAAEVGAVKDKSWELSRDSGAHTLADAVKGGLVSSMQAAGKDTAALEQSFAISGHSLNIDGQTATVTDVQAPAAAPAAAADPVPAPAPQPNVNNDDGNASSGIAVSTCPILLLLAAAKMIMIA